MSQGIQLQQAMNFTRTEEAEADRVGIGLLADAGFRVTAMADFFESMGQRTDSMADYGNLELLRNHPVTRDRIAEARARAAQYNQTQVNESGLFPWMQERLRVVAAPAEKDMTLYYSGLRERCPAARPPDCAGGAHAASAPRLLPGHHGTVCGARRGPVGRRRTDRGAGDL
jgi:predicted Zn-dependent protease